MQSVQFASSSSRDDGRFVFPAGAHVRTVRSPRHLHRQSKAAPKNVLLACSPTEPSKDEPSCCPGTFVMNLQWPASQSDIARIQSERKRRAVELAARAPLFRERLKGIDLDRLDDPDVWARIPLLTKDALRQI